MNPKLYKQDYMITMKDVVKEKDITLYKIPSPVQTPLKDIDNHILENMMTFLKNSQNEQISSKYKLRSGVGLSANQLGLDKRMCVIYLIDENNIEHEYNLINPKVMRKSIHQIYLPQGEGCLSVNRSVYGIVPRSEHVTIKYQNKEGVEQTMKLKSHASIVAQHEIDHLNGIMFFDRINKENSLTPPNGANALY
ncbi:MAG: peptide deformylase [Staphylococcus pseudoxylosus]|uniref:peptide deformylase n=1 Tax=Staphylococcus pseudoxylosus TaxID=2282419 RepID=UPI0031F6C57F